jgi:hypothetical protein
MNAIQRDDSRITTYDNDDETVIIDINYSQIQPDIEELTQNMEDNEDNESKKSEIQNLGKLEYSIDYDFQKQEVSKE